MAPSHVRVVARLHVMQLIGENACQPLSPHLLPAVVNRFPCRPSGSLRRTGCDSSGSAADGVASFKGIPHAEPPVGNQGGHERQPYPPHQAKAGPLSHRVKYSQYGHQSPAARER
jgi:hypothetical protein